jgi:ligand-binding sensor protein
MKYKFVELIDAEKLYALMDSFYKMTGIQSSIIDVDGNLVYVKDKQIFGVGWQAICTDFHRVNPETCRKCVESDTLLARQINEGEKYACYQCHNGLWEVAVPIYIDNEHVVNLFTGQFFFKPPDLDFFKKQARRYGFDETAYLKAVAQVPVYSRETIEQSVEFLMSLAKLIIEMSVAHKRLLEFTEDLEKRIEERTANLMQARNKIKVLSGLIPICANCKKIRNDDGYYEQIEKYISEHSEAEFSHGICPDCMKLLYPDFEIIKKQKKL